MRTVETLLGDRPASARVVRAPAAPAGRHRLGGLLPWPALRAGIRLGRDRSKRWSREIAARFVKRYNPKRERCWIAERDGQNVGSVFVVEKSPTVAQLRLLIVDPSARGAGIGRRLVAECIAFARRGGYRKLMLWTNGGLDAARHLYEDAGFRLTREARHHSFGKDLVGQTFILDLRATDSGAGRK